MTAIRHLLADEFVIDEKPVDTFLTREEGIADLAELVSGMLRENDRLTDLAQELKSRAANPDEVDKLVRGILPTLDSFERMLTLGRSYPKSEEVDNWLKSLESIYFRLLTMLEGFQLVQLKCVGQVVNLDLHEVVEYRPSKDHPNDVVVSERQKGYVFRGKLLRDAKVVVAYNERSMDGNL